jgi:hypothetical protein
VLIRDAGLLPALEAGLLCHDSVPDLAKLLALWGTCELRSDVCDRLETEAAEFLAEPKPLNSGMSFVGDGGPDGVLVWSIPSAVEGVVGVAGGWFK